MYAFTGVCTSLAVRRQHHPLAAFGEDGWADRREAGQRICGCRSWRLLGEETALDILLERRRGKGLDNFNSAESRFTFLTPLGLQNFNIL